MWTEKPILVVSNASIIWKGILKDFLVLGSWLKWRVGNGMQIFLGINPIVGVYNGSSFLRNLFLLFVLVSGQWVELNGGSCRGVEQFYKGPKYREDTFVEGD